MGVQRLLTAKKRPQARVDGIAVFGLRDRLRTRSTLRNFLDLLCPVSQIDYADN